MHGLHHQRTHGRGRRVSRLTQVGNDLTQLRYDTSAGELRYNVNSGGYAAGPTNPFGAPTISNKHYSLYATYTASGGGGSATAPYFTYAHTASVVSGDGPTKRN